MSSAASPRAQLRADGQKSHGRPSLRGELAQDNETHRFAGQGKCGSCASTVHVLIRGDLSGFAVSMIKRVGLRAISKELETPPNVKVMPGSRVMW